MLNVLPFCSAMEQSEHACKVDSNTLFLTNLKYQFDIHLFDSFKKGDRYEFILSYIHDTKTPLITKALVIENFATKNQIIKLYWLTKTAFDELQMPRHHWLYTDLQKEKTLQSIVMDEYRKYMTLAQSKSKLTFDYANSELFEERTSEFTYEIKVIDQALSHYKHQANAVLEKKFISCKAIITPLAFFEYIKKIMPPATKTPQSNTLEFCQFTKLHHYGFHVQQSLVIKHVGTEKESYHYFIAIPMVPQSFLWDFCTYPTRHWTSDLTRREELYSEEIGSTYILANTHAPEGDFDFENSTMFVDETERYKVEISQIHNLFCMLRN